LDLFHYYEFSYKQLTSAAQPLHKKKRYRLLLINIKYQLSSCQPILVTM